MSVLAAPRNRPPRRPRPRKKRVPPKAWELPDALSSPLPGETTPIPHATLRTQLSRTRTTTRMITTITLRLLLRLEPHRTLVELDFTESIERFSLDPKPIPELPEKRVLGNAHEYRSDW